MSDFPIITLRSEDICGDLVYYVAENDYPLIETAKL